MTYFLNFATTHNRIVHFHNKDTITSIVLINGRCRLTVYDGVIVFTNQNQNFFFKL